MSGRSDSLRKLESELGVLLRRVKRVSGERARMVHPELSGVSLIMLDWLANNGASRASRLCGIFELDKAAVSRHLHHLEELGLVERTPDPEDGRATLLTPTEDAVRRMAEVERIRREILDNRLGDWTAEELAAFVDELSRYNKTLE